MPVNINEIEKRLWSAADELRATSKLFLWCKTEETFIELFSLD